MSITDSTYTVSAQADGRRYIRERHTSDDGKVYEIPDWLDDGALDVQVVLAARAALLTQQIAATRAASAFVAGTLLPLPKLKFRELFTGAEREGIDELHATFEAHPGLNAAQKRAIRTGLEDFKNAAHINKPFDARVLAMLGLYVALGLLTAARRDEIVSAGNG